MNTQDPKNYNGEEGFYSRQDKLDIKRPIWRRYLWQLIACIALLLVVVFATTTIYLLANHAQGTTVVTLPQIATATPTVSTQIPPTATPSPTPMPQVMTINQTMTCTDCSNTANFSLVVRSATIDSTSKRVSMVIGVQNNTTDTTYTNFNFLKFQDMQTSLVTNGAGDGFSNFLITANQLILTQPEFPFAPIAGHHYSFSAEMGNYSFTPITITFG